MEYSSTVYSSHSASNGKSKKVLVVILRDA